MQNLTHTILLKESGAVGSVASDQGSNRKLFDRPRARVASRDTPPASQFRSEVVRVLSAGHFGGVAPIYVRAVFRGERDRLVKHLGSSAGPNPHLDEPLRDRTFRRGLADGPAGGATTEAGRPSAFNLGWMT